MYQETVQPGGRTRMNRRGYAVTATGLLWLGRISLGFAVLTLLGALVGLLDLDVWRGFLAGFGDTAARELGAFSLQAIQAGLVLAATGYIALQLSPILDSVGTGDAFDPANPVRLRRIAVTLAGLCALRVGQQLLVADAAAGQSRDLTSAVLFDLVPWLLVILTSVLADVFARGSEIRLENQETT